MRYFFTLMCSIIMITNTFAQLLPMYPSTATDNTTDNYFGTVVADPYRWLEDENSPQTKEWIKRENDFEHTNMKNIPFVGMVKKDLTQLVNYPKQGIPKKVGKYYYYTKNNGLQNQAILYRSDLSFRNETIVINPNKWSTEGTMALSGYYFSKTGKYMAYLVSNAGSDWQTLYIMNTATRELLKQEKLSYLKFSNVAWTGDYGFYYSRFPKPNESKKYSDQSKSQQVYYHRIGNPQSKDILVYEDKKNPLQYVHPSMTEDESFLVLSISQGTSGNQILVRNLKAKQTTYTTLIKGFDTESTVIDNDGNQLLVLTNSDAPNYKVVAIDPKNTDSKNWKTIIAEQSFVLQQVTTAGKQLFAHYLKDVISSITQYTYQGKKIRTIDLPDIGTVAGFDGKLTDETIFYSLTSFAIPTSIYAYNLQTGKSALHFSTTIKDINLKEYETKQVFFTAEDGARIPMFITAKKGIVMDGNNPTLLYGYGGFNIAITPSFSPAMLYFMSQGGIYAVANIRGGSEYGEKWHEAGMFQNKQTVFNDFIDAAEYLINQKYTSQTKLAISGRSNGGLLVGACLTQRPDLYRVALPQVGVLDMLRYHLFTVGWGWKTEYGSSEKENEFSYLYKYSPYHNIKIGATYPATMVVTADHDDRVVPAHSFKFAARLQMAQAAANSPIVLKVTSNAGHGMGKPIEKWIDDEGDVLSFMMYYLGMNPKSL